MLLWHSAHDFQVAEKKSFIKHRKQHYNEFIIAKQLAAKLAEEEEEEDNDDNDDQQTKKWQNF